MRSELTALSNFSLPEYYFRVSRQEHGHGGKYFRVSNVFLGKICNVKYINTISLQLDPIISP